MKRGGSVLLPWLVLGAIGTGPGCNSVCTGPGCEASYGTARLSWIRALADGPERDVWADADGAWSGNAPAGTGWRVTTVGQRILTGQPDADQVVASSARITRDTLNPLSSWSGPPGSAFGSDLVAIPGENVFDLWVGAPGHDFGKGAAFLFRATSFDQRTHDTPQVVLTGGTPNDRFGAALVRCGDLTGDGVPELLVGAPWFAQPGRDVPWTGRVEDLAGAVFMVRSDRVDTPKQAYPWEVGPVWFAPDPGAGVGNAMACDRDLDGDGTADVLVGAPYADAGSGRLYVLSGADLPEAGSLEGLPYVVGTQAGDWFGASVATMEVGGSPMVLVGAPGARTGSGRVYALRGADVTTPPTSRTGAVVVTAQSVFRPEEDLDGQHFGRRLYTGDVDGDTRTDLLIGTPDAHGPGANDFDTGTVEVWFGPEEAWATTESAPHARIVGTQPFQGIGRSVATADLDQDGTDEVLLTTRAPTRDGS